MNRRTLLRAVGATAVAGVAGCSANPGSGVDSVVEDDEPITEPDPREITVPEIGPDEYEGDAFGVDLVDVQRLRPYRETAVLTSLTPLAARLRDWREETFVVSGLDGSFALFANVSGPDAVGLAVEGDDPERSYGGFDLYETEAEWAAVGATTVILGEYSEPLRIDTSTALERVIDAWNAEGDPGTATDGAVGTLVGRADGSPFARLDVPVGETFEGSRAPSRPAGASAGLFTVDVDAAAGTAEAGVAATFPSDPDAAAVDAVLDGASGPTRRLPFRNPSVSVDGSTVTAAESHELNPVTDDEGNLNFLADDYVVDVTASQYEWRFTHPDGTAETDGLRVPTGEPIALRLTSADVLHGFYIPEFGINVDVHSDAETRVLFAPPDAGRIEFFCSEYCGVGHSQHKNVIRVE